MWHSRKLNNKIDRLQERALSIVYDDKSSAFYQLLEKDNSVTIHTRNLQYLATEIFKIKIGISPIIMTEIFKFSDNTTHNLRSGQVLERRHNRTTNFGVESISTLGAKMWALVPENLRQRHSTLSSEALKSGTQVTVLVDCVRFMYKTWPSFD